MKGLYHKNLLGFSLIWIGVYVVGFSLADGISQSLGTEKLVTLPFALLAAGILVAFLLRNGLSAQLGLCRCKLTGRQSFYYLPLVLMASVNLWGGVKGNLSPVETVLSILTMLLVGFLEELIFRGFLFTALRKDNLKVAVIVSSVTFGVGHIVNLLNGAPVGETLLQIVYATAAGFLFTVIFLRGGSLWPCILAHSAVNSLSVIAGPQGPALEIVAAAALTVVSLVYGIWILKETKNDDPAHCA